MPDPKQTVDSIRLYLKSQSTTVSVTPGTTGTATLDWTPPVTNTDGTALTPLTGYTVFYGTSQNSLTKSVVVSGASTTAYEITGLAAGTYLLYFAAAGDPVVHSIQFTLT